MDSDSHEKSEDDDEEFVVPKITHDFSDKESPTTVVPIEHHAKVDSPSDDEPEHKSVEHKTHVQPLEDVKASTNYESESVVAPEKPAQNTWSSSPEAVAPISAQAPVYAPSTQVNPLPPQAPIPTFQTANVSPVPPQPPADTNAFGFSAGSTMNPQAVVRVLSPRGVEYVFMTVALFTGAIGLATALLALVNGKTSFTVLYFPLSLLLVSVPVFSLFFLRLKQAEVDNPAAKYDPSKRRSTQFIQIISYLICFFTLIGLVAIIFDKVQGSYGGSIVKVILDVLVILLVAGGILFYYWNDEHKTL